MRERWGVKQALVIRFKALYALLYRNRQNCSNNPFRIRRTIACIAACVT